MKFAASGFAAFATAACVFACSAFTTASDNAAPAPDAGVDTGVASSGGVCVPVVADASAPPACLDGRADLLLADRMNCGQCGRVCASGAACADGQCMPLMLASETATSIALIGTNLYVAHALDTDIGVIDVSASTPSEQSFLLGNFTAPFRKMTAYDGKLWVSTEKEQAIVETSKAVSANPLIARANTTDNGGIFYPGNVAFYTYAALDTSKVAIARFADTVSTYGPYTVSALDAHDGELVFATGVNVYRLPEVHIIQSGTQLAGLGATKDFAYFAENGFVIRAAADHADPVAAEPGKGVKFTVVGDTLYYTAHRVDPLRERDVLVRVKTCGGAPLVIYDHGGSTISDFVIADSYAYIANGEGVWRVDL